MPAPAGAAAVVTRSLHGADGEDQQADQGHGDGFGGAFPDHGAPLLQDHLSFWTRQMPKGLHASHMDKGTGR
jgi:hypothetical protein